MIYCGDCRTILPELGPVDLVLTDPPYGIGADKNAFKNGVHCRANGFKKHLDTNWDASPVDSELLKLVIAKGEKSIIWGGNYFALPPAKCWLVWNKDTARVFILRRRACMDKSGYGSKDF